MSGLSEFYKYLAEQVKDVKFKEDESGVITAIHPSGKAKVLGDGLVLDAEFRGLINLQSARKASNFDNGKIVKTDDDSEKSREGRKTEDAGEVENVQTDKESLQKVDNISDFVSNPALKNENEVETSPAFNSVDSVTCVNTSNYGRTDNADFHDISFLSLPSEHPCTSKCSPKDFKIGDSVKIVHSDGTKDTEMGVINYLKYDAVTNRLSEIWVDTDAGVSLQVLDRNCAVLRSEHKPKLSPWYFLYAGDKERLELFKLVRYYPGLVGKTFLAEFENQESGTYLAVGKVVQYLSPNQLQATFFEDEESPPIMIEGFEDVFFQCDPRTLQLTRGTTIYKDKSRYFIKEEEANFT